MIDSPDRRGYTRQRMNKRSDLRARIGLLRPPLRRVLLAAFGPQLDLPDDANI